MSMAAETVPAGTDPEKAFGILHGGRHRLAPVVDAGGQLGGSSGGDGTVKLWEASSGRLLASLSGHTGVVRGVALRADRQFGARGGERGAGAPL